MDVLILSGVDIGSLHVLGNAPRLYSSSDEYISRHVSSERVPQSTGNFCRTIYDVTIHVVSSDEALPVFPPVHNPNHVYILYNQSSMHCDSLLLTPA